MHWHLDHEPIRCCCRTAPRLSESRPGGGPVAVPSPRLWRWRSSRTGYVILGLRQQVEVLAAENARLLATTSALRAPDRIERIARADLGMLTPRPQQVAALPITTPTRAIAGPSPSAWDRLAAWFIRSEAAAGEPSQ